MRVLLDTNILIYREARTAVRDDIGDVFRWMDQLGHQKLVHPASVAEVRKHADAEVVRTLGIKLGSYGMLKTTAPDTPGVADLRESDRNENDEVDTSLLAELAAGRVDALLTEDRGIHRKAARLGLSSSVFTIEAFLEKAVAENPELADYRVLAVQKSYFGEIDLSQTFFDSFRADYVRFDSWFNRKADEIAYVCTGEDGELVAFLYLKREDRGEDYSDIRPPFRPGTRLKIGTFKVVANGFKLGERFLKIVFDNALKYGVDQIYVTMFRHTPDQDRLYRLLEDWGFVHHGQKEVQGGVEEVMVRDFRPAIDLDDPRRTYPYVAANARKFIVPIYPAYHTELLPDSILRTESPLNFVENRPNRNAISKVYVSRSLERSLRTGDIIVFYRTRSGDGPAWYTSVATTIGVVQDVVDDIGKLEEFLEACRKRSVFTNEELQKQWDWRRYPRPFVVNFLYVYSLPRRPNLEELSEEGIIREAPRGFEPLTDRAFTKLLEITGADQRFVVR
jgi:hypothetical protein